eukprot:6508556-Pyramimonas_sp.AAC.1
MRLGRQECHRCLVALGLLHAGPHGPAHGLEVLVPAVHHEIRVQRRVQKEMAFRHVEPLQDQ